MSIYATSPIVAVTRQRRGAGLRAPSRIEMDRAVIEASEEGLGVGGNDGLGAILASEGDDRVHGVPERDLDELDLAGVERAPQEIGPLVSRDAMQRGKGLGRQELPARAGRASPLKYFGRPLMRSGSMRMVEPAMSSSASMP